ncbi:MAG: aconitate hydratase [Chloroflexi bacterium]|nr:aconitate hydratase [Chloroflexota bacterium]
MPPRRRDPGTRCRRRVARPSRRPVPGAVRPVAVRLHGSSVSSIAKDRPLPSHDPFGARASLGPGLPDLYRLDAIGDRIDLDSAPVTLKILLENALRHAGGGVVNADDVERLASWRPGVGGDAEIPFMPSRVVLQDFTGVPAVVDLAAMRDAVAAIGGDPARVNPLVPADLVIDHSVQVDRFGTPGAFAFNVEREYERNGERYQLLRWAQTAFRDLRVVPPGTGIIHQVNLEFLAPVVDDRSDAHGRVAFPDTLVGTDSHTTMINALGVLGYGVGGIEAEAVLLGQPLYQPMPRIIGVRLHGEMPRGSTATDLVLVVTEMLRGYGVVGAFVEFAGDGLAGLTLADRATISNMSPEFGATSTLFPIDDETLAYLRLTGRPTWRVDLVERYAREQGLWRAPGRATAFDDVLELDLATVVPSVAGPRRPQDRVPLAALRENFRTNFPDGLESMSQAALEQLTPDGGLVESSSADSFPASDAPSFALGDETAAPAPAEPVIAAAMASSGYRSFPVTAGDAGGASGSIATGSVAIAAITSCTNTSNPTVMIGAGLLARNAIARGLSVAPTVKTSLAPGSKAVTAYLENAGLMAPLASLGFALAGYGCTTCIGNSGPLDPAVAAAVEANDLVVAAVLSGNRNFEGRIHPLARASYLASPPLVVAFALAGRVDIDLEHEPIGIGDDGRPVHLADIWPAPDEIRAVIRDSIDPDLFARTYATVFEGDERWRALPIPAGDRYDWDDASTYVARPPFFDGMGAEPAPIGDLVGARALAVLGDSVTTDHISPAGSIAPSSPAGQWLQAHGVPPLEFNSYGARRGHHEVMIRGTFANIRLRNALAEGREGPWTRHLPDATGMPIYDAAMRYAAEGTPLIVLAGREYGTGSSRDWAAKGTALLGIRAVIAESYERIHRSNLVGMGVLPLQYVLGETAASLGLTGRERYTIEGVAGGPEARSRLTVHATDDGSGQVTTFEVVCRLDGPIEVGYIRHGGILPAVVRRLAATPRTA